LYPIKEKIMRLYVGNLSYQVTEKDLRDAFAAYEHVESVAVIIDRTSGRSNGFGFVEISDEAEAKAAIEEMDGKVLEGRALKVNEARQRPDKPRGGRGGTRGGGRSQGGRDGHGSRGGQGGKGGGRGGQGGGRGGNR
jgi:RNA recognition motif-containing protein